MNKRQTAAAVAALTIAQGIVIEFRPKLAVANQINQIPTTTSNPNSTTERSTEEATIRQLTLQWFEAWSPGTEPFDVEKLRPLFAQGDGELLVFDDIGDEVVVLRSWQEYQQTWEPFMQQFSYWSIQPQGNIEVMVDDNLAVSTFTYVGEGRYQDGREIALSQHGTLVWEKQNGNWVIVHEHLTVAGD